MVNSQLSEELSIFCLVMSNRGKIRSKYKKSKGCEFMRKFIWFSLLLLTSVLLLGACVKNADVDDKDVPTISSKPETEGGSMETGDGYGFVTLDLTIDVDDEEVISTSYDVTKKAEATYIDDLADIDVEGNDAMDELFYLFDHMRLTKDTPDEETIDKIMEHYELDDYSNLKLDVEFDEGTMLHIDDDNEDEKEDGADDEKDNEDE